tara:strand:+ start:236 stop:571 length:336 start_codon:yes stop_codon:yes gene_type:complete
MDPVEAARLATEAAAAAGDEEEQKKRQLKLAHSISRGKRQRHGPRLSNVTESMHERGSIILKRASILLLGDPVQEKKGLFSCCLGGGKAAKYEVDKENSNSTSEEEEDEGW